MTAPAPDLTSLAALQAPCFIASDIDGTLLDSRERIQPRVRDAILRAVRGGTSFALATGRPARWLMPVLDQLPIRPIAVCSNGAVVYDTDTDEIIRGNFLGAEILQEIVPMAREALKKAKSDGLTTSSELGVAAERAGGSAWDPPEELFAVSKSYVHLWESTEHSVETEAEILGKPATKLLMSGPGLMSQELYDIIAPAIPEELAHVTFSMPDGLLEISAPGVTKRSALESVVTDLGLTTESVVAFGDMPNDIEMLSWAGLGVAMGNARPEVKDAADVVTAANDDSGIAEVLETWF